MSEGDLRFRAVADRALGQAVRGGATDAEVYIVHEHELTARIYEGEIESLTSAEARGLGVRVFDDHRVGFAYTTDVGDSGVTSCVEEALAACRHAHPDEHVGLPDTQLADPLPGLVADDFASWTIEERIALGVELDRRVVAVHPAVRRSAGTVYGDERTHVEIHTTRDLAAAYESTAAFASTEAIAERDGEMQTGFSFTYGRSASALDLEGCAREAAERAARVLGARPVGSRRCPIVLEPWAAAALLGTLAASIGADAVHKGRSLLAGRLGEPVAAAAVTLVDDGRRVDALGARPWDAEGVPTQRTEVIGQGVLRGFLHTTQTARRAGLARSTGNAVRSSFRSTPEVGPTNLYLVPGEASLEELLRRLEDGILVYDVRGLHTVNAITGEFSLGITGALVERGTLGQPVREVTIAGTLLEVLGAVEGVGSDLRFLAGAGFVGSPSVLVRDVAVSGP